LRATKRDPFQRDEWNYWELVEVAVREVRELKELKEAKSRSSRRWKTSPIQQVQWPAMIVRAEAFDRNVKRMIEAARRGGKTIRLATKVSS